MITRRLITFGTVFILLISSCVQVNEKAITKRRELTQKGKKLYAEKIKPLTPEECSRCHFTVYELIQKKGGKHQFECTNCHKKYHIYNPLKQNYSEIMPKCQACHGLIHGEILAKCNKCHINAHSPKDIPMSAFLEKNCLNCHIKQRNEMNQFPSKHKNQSCSSCHTSHGYIPSCIDCHEPHTAWLAEDKQCLACHPAHTPTRSSRFAKDTSNDICATCHGEIVATLDANRSKHHNLTCVSCHKRHKYIPKCKECHKEAHSKKLLEKFKNCSQCHIDPHNLILRAATK